MVLWRISRHHDLSGLGGLRLPGRWHHIGHPVVYLANSPAAALLEICAHTAANDVPPSYALLKVSAPDNLAIMQIDISSPPQGWQDRPDLTADIGSNWLNNETSALLEVPSAIVPETLNVLLNPLHPDAVRCTIIDNRSYPFDPRLKR